MQKDLPTIIHILSTIQLYYSNGLVLKATQKFRWSNKCNNLYIYQLLVMGANNHASWFCGPCANCWLVSGYNLKCWYWSMKLFVAWHLTTWKFSLLQPESAQLSDLIESSYLYFYTSGRGGSMKWEGPAFLGWCWCAAPGRSDLSHLAKLKKLLKMKLFWKSFFHFKHCTNFILFFVPLYFVVFLRFLWRCLL